MSLEHNKTSLGGKSDNSSRPTFAAGAATALDELTKRQRRLFPIAFHDLRIRRINDPPQSGVSPMRDLGTSPNTMSGFGVQTCTELRGVPLTPPMG